MGVDGDWLGVDDEINRKKGARLGFENSLRVDGQKSFPTFRLDL